MINLLPPREKNNLLLEQKKAIIIRLWLLVVFFFVCLSLILFSVSFYLKIQVKNYEEELKKVELELGQSEVQAIQEEINSVNSSLEKLNQFYNKNFYLSDIFSEISEVLSPGIYLSNISFMLIENEGSLIKVSLSGFSPTREALFDFKESIEQKQRFKQVYFPASNWVKPTDINFSANFEISIYEP